MRRALSAAICITAIFCLAAADTFAAAKDSIQLSASVDRKSIRIGDRIKLTVKAVAPKTAEVRFPAFDDYKIGDLEIKDSGSRSRYRVFGGRVYTNWYSVTAYSVGKVTIPPIDVKFRKKGQKDWSVQKTTAIDITVVSVLPAGKQAADIRGIKGPLDFRNVYWGIIALLGAFLFFAGAAVVLYRRLKRYEPVKLPHETALEELESIRAAYLQGGDVKDYYFGVSDCIRHYIERAFRLKAPEMTTEEFLNSLKDSAALSIEQKDLLKGFLVACDMVKFAKYAPSRAEAESLYETAGTFIRQTSRPPENTGGPS